MSSTQPANLKPLRHRAWVKTTHWLITLSFLLLAFTGFEILMVHPRLYWGESGNDLTPALFELPISRNYKHEGWKDQQAFFASQGSPVSASRTYEIFNQNGWGRSLHFLSAWFLVLTGLVYFVVGFATGHFGKNLWPRSGERNWSAWRKEVANHFRLRIPQASGGPQYSLLQRTSYLAVVFVLFPLMVVTGFTMSPAITAAFPFLLDLFGGYQSARTIHFFASVALELFLIIHIVMIIASGFKKQIRAMTIGI